MREILFRGKRFSNGEWVIGGIMKTFHPNYDCENEEEFLSQSPNCYCICANNKDYFVEQTSIGQYTGLTDKNGKKIFEGDIIRVDDTEIAVVEYDETSAFYMAVFDRAESDFGSLIGQYPNVEIIGNVHDNPELVKGAKDDAD